MILSVRSPTFLVLLIMSGGGLGCGQGQDLVGPASGVLRVISAAADGVGNPDGLAVTVDDGDEMPFGLGDTLETPLGTGAYSVLLGGLPADCVVDGDNPRPVRIFEDETTVVEFRVVCAPPRGTLVVTTTTSGTALDPDGYTVAADPAAAVPAGPNDRVIVGNLAAGEHLLRLSGVAANCTVAGENPRTVQISAADTAAAAFSVTCRPAPSGRIAFGRNSELLVMEVDAATLVNLSLEYELRGSPLEFIGSPAWSRDGRRLAFASDNGITVIDADPSPDSPLPNRLTSSGDDDCPEWSPDGGTIVFATNIRTTVRTVDLGTGLQTTLFVGSEPFAVEGCPVWSPDGRQIAFVTGGDVVVIGADGGALTPLFEGLPGQLVAEVSWSPDGKRLAIVAERSPAHFEEEIFILDLATGGLLDVTRGRFSLPIEPTWSPDGSRIVFTSLGPPSGFRLFMLNADGSGLIQLTFPPEDSDDRDPAWGAVP